MRNLSIRAILAAAALALLAAGCGTATTSSNVNTNEPAIAAPAPAATSAPADHIKGCSAKPPATYDEAQTIVWQGACDDEQDGGLPTQQGNPSGWCKVYADDSPEVDPVAKLVAACMAGVKAGGG